MLPTKCPSGLCDIRKVCRVTKFCYTDASARHSRHLVRPQHSIARRWQQCFSSSSTRSTVIATASADLGQPDEDEERVEINGDDDEAEDEAYDEQEQADFAAAEFADAPSDGGCLS